MISCAICKISLSVSLFSMAKWWCFLSLQSGQHIRQHIIPSDNSLGPFVRTPTKEEIFSLFYIFSHCRHLCPYFCYNNSYYLYHCTLLWRRLILLISNWSPLWIPIIIIIIAVNIIVVVARSLAWSTSSSRLLCVNRGEKELAFSTIQAPSFTNASSLI